MLRVQLINSIVGQLIIDRNDPIDINSVVKEIRRDRERFGVFHEIVLDFKFIEQAREYLKKCYETAGGIDALVTVLIYKYNSNLYTWKNYYTGKVNFNTGKLTEIDFTVTLEQTGIDRQVLNGLEKDVDLETLISDNGTALPAQPFHLPPYHSKLVIVQFEGVAENEQLEYHSFDLGNGQHINDVYLPFTIDASEINDVLDYFELGIAPFQSVLPGSVPTPNVDQTGNQMTVNRLYRWKLKYGGDYTFTFPKVRGKITTVQDPGSAPNEEHSLTLELVYGKPNNYITQELASVSGIDNVDLILNVNNVVANVNLQANDEVFLYLRHHTPGYLVPGVAVTWNFFSEVGGDTTEVKVRGLTSFTPTNVKTILIHEAFERCVMFLTNQVDCFYSDLLGRVDIGYAADGEYSLLGLTNGKWLRGIDDFNFGDIVADDPKTKLFFSLDGLLKFLDSLTPIGFSFEVINGKRVFRVEKITHYFNKNLKAASLGKVANVEKQVIANFYHNQIEYGYSEEIDIGIVNGVDAFNTFRKAIIPNVNTKNKIDVSTNIIADGYVIEAQRRMTGLTEDSKYDDKNFVIVLLRDGIGYKTKKNEGYSSIVNVIDPATGYNFDIAPGRNLRNRKEVIASQLVRNLSKVVKFSSGTSNYLAQTQKVGEAEPVVENGSLDCSNVVPIWDNEKYILRNVAVSDELIEQIENAVFGYIEFQDQFDKWFYGFIMPGGAIKHRSEQGLADFELLKVYRL